jgi:RNA polymerase sigma-70 factor (ECF subfamily)
MTTLTAKPSVGTRAPRNPQAAPGMNDNQSAAPPDEELVRQALQGDDAAFTELVRRHKNRVFGINSKFARDAHELEDLSQDVFVTAYRKLHKYRGDAPFEHWLCRIATNKCYDLLRKRKSGPTNVDFDAVGYALPDDAGEEQRRGREAREILERGMQRLKPAERLVITLLELEGRPVKEIAGLTGWSESKVKVQAFRARKKLKDLLEPEMN